MSQPTLGVSIFFATQIDKSYCSALQDIESIYKHSRTSIILYMYQFDYKGVQVSIQTNERLLVNYSNKTYTLSENV